MRSGHPAICGAGWGPALLVPPASALGDQGAFYRAARASLFENRKHAQPALERLLSLMRATTFLHLLFPPPDVPAPTGSTSEKLPHADVS